MLLRWPLRHFLVLRPRLGWEALGPNHCDGRDSAADYFLGDAAVNGVIKAATAMGGHGDKQRCLRLHEPDNRGRGIVVDESFTCDTEAFVPEEESPVLEVIPDLAARAVYGVCFVFGKNNRVRLELRDGRAEDDGRVGPQPPRYLSAWVRCHSQEDNLVIGPDQGRNIVQYGLGESRAIQRDNDSSSHFGARGADLLPFGPANKGRSALLSGVSIVWRSIHIELAN
jgi:hypothetical protein